MRKSVSDFSLRAAAVIVLSGSVIAFLLAAADRAPAADLGAAAVVHDERLAVTFVCGQPVDEIVLFDEWGRPTIPARTPMFTCITGTTLVASLIPPSPEYCCR